MAAAMISPATGPAIPSSTTTTASGGLPPPHRSSSAPPSAAATATTTQQQSNVNEHVAECTYEFLLAEILQWVERDEKRIAEEAKRVQALATKAAAEQQGTTNTNNSDGDGDAAMAEEIESNDDEEDEAAAAVMAAERSAARIERMGYDVGYRLCERLAQHRPLLGPGSPSPETGTIDAPMKDGSGSGSGLGGPIIMGGGGHHTVMDPKSKFFVLHLFLINIVV